MNQISNFFFPVLTQETLERERERQEPLIIYWIYFAYGIAMLLPWNVFITASDYFSYRFEGSIHDTDFQSYFSAYSNVSNLISLSLFLWLRQSKYISNVDVLIPLSINLLIFLFYTITSLIKTISADFYFKITIICMSMAGITTSLLQLTVFADASQLPPKYMQAVMSGQGIAGVSVALFSLLTTVLHGDGTFFYFSCAFLVTLTSMTGRILLQRRSSYQLVRHSSDIDLTLDTREIPLTSMWDIVFNKSSNHIFVIIYIYVITLAIFPAVTTQITSVNGMRPTLFMSLHFLIFNLGDWIGRTLPILKSCQVASSQVLMGCAILRTLFVPVFLKMMSGSPSDLIFYLSVFLFSVSNGWLTSLVFMVAPNQYDMNSRPLVASIMSYSLVIGLALGGLSSFIVIKLLV